MEIFAAHCSVPPTCHQSPFPLSLTLVVLDGEVGVVEHLRDQPVVEVVALDGVVFVHGADGLDDLRWRGR